MAGIGQRLADEAFGQVADQVDFLGDRDEYFRADEAELRRVPPRQHLEPDQLAGLEVDLLLVVRHELAGGDAAAQAAFELVAEA